MSYLLLGSAIKEVVRFINNKKLDYALIGGLAVSFRTIERTTKDIDFVVAVSSDNQAEKIIRDFRELGFNAVTLMENKKSKAIITVRLLSDNYPSVYLDLLFGATGIEVEIVASGDLISVLPGLEVNIASLSSLIAMKILSSNNPKRLQDLVDLQNLILEASEAELQEAERLIGLIQQRGFDGGVDLLDQYAKFVKKVKDN